MFELFQHFSLKGPGGQGGEAVGHRRCQDPAVENTCTNIDYTQEDVKKNYLSTSTFFMRRNVQNQ